MEKFKACEKEMKTKAFSKEGLIQSAKLDPKTQEKLETTQWLQNCVEELLLQVETAEAEIETLQVGGRKKSKVGASAQERLEELERLNERRKWHINRLEIMLRLLDNGTLTSEQALGLKEDIKYFVECNAVRGNWLFRVSSPSRISRMMISTRTRACMMISTSMRRKRSLVVWSLMSMRVMNQMKLAKVCPSVTSDGSSSSTTT